MGLPSLSCGTKGMSCRNTVPRRANLHQIKLKINCRMGQCPAAASDIARALSKSGEPVNEGRPPHEQLSSQTGLCRCRDRVKAGSENARKIPPGRSGLRRWSVRREFRDEGCRCRRREAAVTDNGPPPARLPRQECSRRDQDRRTHKLSCSPGPPADMDPASGLIRVRAARASGPPEA